MGPTFDQRVAAWDRVAKSSRAQDAIAPERNRPEGYEASGAAHAEKLFEVAPPNLDLAVMDYGCGDGRVTAHLVGKYGRVVGADASQGMLDRLADRAPGVHPVLWDGRGDFPDDADFDVICSFLVLIHYPHEEGREIIAALANLLKPGGMLAIQCPLYDTPRAPVGWTSVGVWTAKQLTIAAQDAGLEVTAIAANRGMYRPGEAGRNHGALQVLHRLK